MSAHTLYVILVDERYASASDACPPAAYEVIVLILQRDWREVMASRSCHVIVLCNVLFIMPRHCAL